jgi:hypothetical protein
LSEEEIAVSLLEVARGAGDTCSGGKAGNDEAETDPERKPSEKGK